MELLIALIIGAAMGLGCLALGFGMFVIPMDTAAGVRIESK